MSKLNNKKVAILSTDGFEESELISPKVALEEEGATVVIVAPKGVKIKGWKDGNWSQEIVVDEVLEQANPDDFDALVLPGGVINPDKLRLDQKAVDFARDFLLKGKPLAAICHGPQTLIETGLLRGKTMTSYAALATDLRNAGANWLDKEVVTDEGLITSRSPEDLPAFNAALIGKLSGNS